MSRATPAVSVCVPAYQAGRHLATALRSVLAQNFTDFELVVLDNASTDDTSEIVRSFPDQRIRLVRNEKTISMTANWNHCVCLSRAPLVKLLCADDVLRPDCLRVQHQLMTANPRLAMTVCRRDFLDAGGRRLATGRGLTGLVGEHDRVAVARRVIRHGGNPIGEPGSVLFRRSAFTAVGGFAEDMNLVLDIHLWLRLLARGSLFGIADSLAAFRISGGSLSGRTHRAGHQQQYSCNAEVVANPIYQVRDLDRLIGAAAAPLALLRRRGLFRIAEFGNHRASN
ncbi:MAG TPA: glycosyltransferase [Pseudonocardiaceae bacterium]|jgi:glycosyltransferase involved in cell wall biosynthesis|nr:glycosyltransferase [Pseudonocardiaceae bacterium]